MEKTKKKKATGKRVLNKSTKAAFDERVGVVSEMLLSGLKRKDIVQNISGSEILNWKVTTRQIDNYIEAATKVILKEFEGERTVLINRLYSQYNFLYKKMVISKDYRGAAAVLDKICMFIPFKELTTNQMLHTEIAPPVIINIVGRATAQHFDDSEEIKDTGVIANSRLIS